MEFLAVSFSLRRLRHIVHLLAVIPAEAGIQVPLKFLDSGLRYPER